MPRPARLVVVGAGLVGKRHVAAINRSAVAELAAIVEPSTGGEEYANANNAAYFEDLDQLFSGMSPDGIILATPTKLHAPQALDCLANNCPVLIEKPITVTANEAAAIVHASQASGVPVLVGHHRRHNPLVQESHRLIREGTIGDVRTAQVTCWFYKPDDYFDDAPWRKQNGAGPISVNLVHDIDLMRHFCGEIVRVQAQASPSNRGYDNEDAATAIVCFESGALGTITVSDGVVAPWSWELTSGEYPVYPKTNQSCYLLGGSEGSLSLPDMTVWKHQGEKSWWNPIGGTVAPRPAADPLCNQIDHFVDVIHGVAEPLVSAEEGWRTLQVIEAIQIAAATQQAVALDPSNKAQIA